MGEVYRAHDERLDREVAIKVLPDAVAQDEARLARFEREAKLLASLNHQNIATLYGFEQADLPVIPSEAEASPRVIPSEAEGRVEESPEARATSRSRQPPEISGDPSTRGAGAPLAQDDIGGDRSPTAVTRTVRFLVMELAEGETLAERIKTGRIPVDEALPIALQITEGLEAAHEQGIIHRDLKPANVMLSPEGKVKILDFGLAKAWHEEVSDVDLTHSPTLTAQMTAAGVLLGTAAYMSPEQARGKAVDRRADIWAFGCVLWEMLTGNRAFQGETVTDVLARIVERDPEWSLLPERTPRRIRELVTRCLKKIPHDRLHDIADARLEIEEAIGRPEWASQDQVESFEPKLREKVRAAWPILLATAVVVALLAGGAVWKILTIRPAASGLPTRLTLSLPPGVEFAEHWYYFPTLAISPDGRWLVFAAEEGDTWRLFKRSLEQFDAVAMPGTEGGYQPFFSPDGHWVGFFALDGLLKKVPLAGGPPQILCPAENPFGGTWGPDGTIVFNRQDGTGLWRVPATGGEPEQIVSPQLEQGDAWFRWPEFLPDGGAVLFTVLRGVTADSARIELLDLGSRERKIVLENGSHARYVPTGHLIFGRAGRVEAAPFNAARREVTGPSVPVPEPIMYESDLGVSQLDLSARGTLAFIPGGGAPRLQLVSVDLDGTERPLIEARRRYMYPRFSPDGERLAVAVAEPGDTNVWVVDLRTGAQTKLTREGINTLPVWAPDGERVTYLATQGVATSIDWRRADGSGEAESLVSSLQPGEVVMPGAWSPDGEWLVYHRYSASEQSAGIWITALDGDPEPRPLVASGAGEGAPAISPDGDWLAYASPESGQIQVYVQPFPDGGERHQVSTDGGLKPVWSPDGGSIYYRSGDGQVMVVAVSTSPRFRAGDSEVVGDDEYLIGTHMLSPNFDIAPDGRSFAFVKADEEWGRATEIRLVLDWFEELKRLVPVG
jgi:serine/threonine-protein kinase